MAVRDNIKGYVSDSIHILFVLVKFDGERGARRPDAPYNFFHKSLYLTALFAFKYEDRCQNNGGDYKQGGYTRADKYRGGVFTQEIQKG